MNELIIEIFGAFISSVGFSVIFQAHRRRLIFCGLSGAVGWLACCLAELNTPSVFVMYFVGTAVVTLYSEIMARITKVPATVYLIPGLLPMVPGGSLYYTTSALVTRDAEGVSYFGQQTALAAVGIACGLVVISVVMYYYNDHVNRRLAKLAQGNKE